MYKNVDLHCWMLVIRKQDEWVLTKTTSVLVIQDGDKWILTSQHKLVASTWDTIDLILSRYHIICMVNPMPKWSNLEIMYVGELDISPFNILLRPCLAKFDIRDFHVTGRYISQNVHWVKNTHCNRCIYPKTRTKRDVFLLKVAVPSISTLFCLIF